MSISILQWNVYYKEDIRNIAKFLNALKADIICLQELTLNYSQDIINTPTFIADQLEYNYYYKAIPIKFGDGRELTFANGIFSRFPIVRKRFAWTQRPTAGGGYDDGSRVYIETVLNVGGLELSVGTTHMSYTHRFQETANKHKEADLLVNELKKPTKAFVFAGDLNVVPDSQTIRDIQAVLRNVGPDFEQKTWATKPFSYNGFEETKLNWRLDYVFASPDIKVLSSKILKTDYSDHLPILVELELS